MKPIRECAEGNSEAVSPSTGVSELRSTVHQLVSGAVTAPEAGGQETYKQRAKCAFIQARSAMDEVPENERLLVEAETLPALETFFLEQEQLQPGDNRFSFQEASNSIIRDTKNPRFHQALMAHFMDKEAVARTGHHPELLKLAIQAKEFNAVQIRRTGEPMLKQDDTRGEGLEMMSQARTTLGAVLHEWELLQDLKSQARTLYELGYIATITDDFRSAADIQEKSANVADQVGEKVGAGIARIERCIALLRGKLETPQEVVSQLEQLLERMRQLDTETSDPRAKEWIANGLVHLSETREAAGDLEGALQCVKDALVPELLKSNIGSKLGDYAKKRIPELEEKLGISSGERWVGLSE